MIKYFLDIHIESCNKRYHNFNDTPEIKPNEMISLRKESPLTKFSDFL